MQRIFDLDNFGLYSGVCCLQMEEAPANPPTVRPGELGMDVTSVKSAAYRPGRGRVFDNIVEAVGDTPIVRLQKLPQQHGSSATILAKLEYFSPAASV